MKNKITKRKDAIDRVNILDHARDRINKLKDRTDQGEISKSKPIAIKTRKSRHFHQRHAEHKKEIYYIRHWSPKIWELRDRSNNWRDTEQTFSKTTERHQATNSSSFKNTKYATWIENHN